jgi:outer membrane phospholipase A
MRVGAYFRNDGEKPLAFTPPASIIVKLVTPEQEMELELVRASKEKPEEQTIAPGSSAFVEYILTLPKTVSGRLVIEPMRLKGAPAVLDVEPAAPKSDTPGAEKPKDPNVAPDAPPPFTPAEQTMSHFSGHEPMYFLAGFDRPSVRFQLSLKYRIANPESPLASNNELIQGLHIAYTQTSLWDLEGDSTPFTDTNYKPEFLWSKDDIKSIKFPGITQLGFQAGVQHESNGGAEDVSRSLSFAYVRPIFYIGERDEFHWQVAPKVYTYIGDLSDNPDIAAFRGYCDLKIAAGRVDGLEVTALGRLGSHGDHGSIQLDASYPLRVLGTGAFDLFLTAQFFAGYGESLITYDERTDAFRIGISVVR